MTCECLFWASNASVRYGSQWQTARIPMSNFANAALFSFPWNKLPRFYVTSVSILVRLCPSTYIYANAYGANVGILYRTHLRPRVCTCTLRRTGRQVSWPDSFRCIWPLINSHRSVWSKFCQCTENADIHALRNCKQNFKGNLGSLMMGSLCLLYFSMSVDWFYC